jgi:hypothetical protein
MSTETVFGDDDSHAEGGGDAAEKGKLKRTKSQAPTRIAAFDFDSDASAKQPPRGRLVRSSSAQASFNGRSPPPYEQQQKPAAGSAGV